MWDGPQDQPLPGIKAAAESGFLAFRVFTTLVIGRGQRVRLTGWVAPLGKFLFGRPPPHPTPPLCPSCRLPLKQASRTSLIHKAKEYGA